MNLNLESIFQREEVIFRSKMLCLTLVDILLELISPIEVKIKKYLDFQNDAKAKGWPWDLSKGQDDFCPISEIISKEINPYEI